MVRGYNKCCEAVNYLKAIFKDSELNISGDVLTSEGVKLLNKALRLILEHCRELSKPAKRARKSRLVVDVEELFGRLLNYCESADLQRDR
jgi:hypothetical protein